MQEDIQKNFILLSKVAKEKKYAQEYMGLLARRGDIGSIRIGKRWYTTWAWFEEFLENSQKKPSFAKATEGDVKINVPFVFPARLPARQEREKVYAASKAENISSEISATIKPKVEASESSFEARADDSQNLKINIAPKKIEFKQAGQQVFIRRQEQKMNVAAAPRIMNQRAPERIAGIRNVRNAWDARREERKIGLPQMISIQKKNANPLPYKEIKFRKNKDVFSPVFEVNEKTHSIFFPRLVFAAGFAIMFLLVAASGYFVFSDGIFKNGTVAGASDERSSVFSGISSGGEYFLTSTGDKIKESLSVSRAVIEAAKGQTAKNASPGDAKAVLSIN